DRAFLAGRERFSQSSDARACSSAASVAIRDNALRHDLRLAAIDESPRAIILDPRVLEIGLAEIGDILPLLIADDDASRADDHASFFLSKDARGLEGGSRKAIAIEELRPTPSPRPPVERARVLLLEDEVPVEETHERSQILVAHRLRERAVSRADPFRQVGLLARGSTSALSGAMRKGSEEKGDHGEEEERGRSGHGERARSASISRGLV